MRRTRPARGDGRLAVERHNVTVASYEQVEVPASQVR
jgi:hypothetical protein